MGRGRRARVLVAATLAIALTPVAAGATTDDSSEVTRRGAPSTREQLTETEQRLDRATGDLAAVEARLDGVQAEVTAAEQQLAALSDQLAVVEDDLAVAQQAARDAERTLDATRARLMALDRDVATADEQFRRATTELNARAAALWMHGPAVEAAVFVDGLGSARNVHDVALVGYATRRELDDDRRVVDDATDAAAVVAAARTVLDAERTSLTTATMAAWDARQHAEVLVARQQQLVEEAARHREARRAALARLEQDAEARAALVDRLTAKVDQLREQALQDWRRERRRLDVDGPTPPWAGRLPGAGPSMAPAVVAAAANEGIDERLFAALVWTESAYRPTAVSPSGAIGLAQLMPPTARELGVDPWNPNENLAGGARYLRIQLDTFGRVDLALAAYNAGPGRVRGAGGRIPDIVETQLYVLRILERWETLR